MKFFLFICLALAAVPVRGGDLENGKQLIKEKQEAQALDILLPLAEGNNAEAQNMVGEIYHFGGKNTPVDYEKAHQWYLKSFQNGNAQAANHLGRMYLNGEGVPSNPEKADYWYYQSMIKGNVTGEINYYASRNSAFSSLLTQALKDNVEAQVAVGKIYQFGNSGIPLDYGKARSWYLKAVTHGNGEAAHHLGGIYFNGEGVSKDLNEAEKWYKRAKDWGYRTNQAED